MCLRSTFWLSFEAMLEMALLVMSPYFSSCYVRVLTCVKSKLMCARSDECVCLWGNALAVVVFLCSEGEVFGKPLLFQLLSPPLLQIWAPTKTNKHLFRKSRFFVFVF